MLVLASASPRRRELLTQAGYSFTVHPAHIPEDPYPGEDPIAYVTRLALEKAQAIYRELASLDPDKVLVKHDQALYQGTTSVVPEVAPYRTRALAPEGSSSEAPTTPGAPGPDSETRESGNAGASGQRASAPPQVVLGADTTVTLRNHILGKPENPADAARMLRLLSGRTHKVLTGIALVTAHSARTACEITKVQFLPLSDEEIAAYIATGEPMDKAGAYAIQGRAARWIPRIEGCYFNVVGLPISLVSTMLQAVGHFSHPRTYSSP